MRGKADFSKSLFIIVHAPFFVTLLLPLRRFPLRVAWFIHLASISATAGIAVYLSFFTASTDRGGDYSNAFYLFNFVLCMADYLLFTDGQQNLRMIGQKIPAYELGWTERVGWGLSLLGSPRGVGWMHEPTKHLPPKPSSDTRRTDFVFKQLGWAGLYAILYDITFYLNMSNPSFGLDARPWDNVAWWWRLTSWGHLISIYTGLCSWHCIYSAISVAVYWTDPSDWPPIFGSSRQAYTVRKFWGTFWHQIMRRPLTVNADFVARTVRLSVNSKISTYAKLFVSFFASGIIHYAADYIVIQDFSGGALKFFLLQAFAIMIEDAVIEWGRVNGFRVSIFWRTVGRVWVVVWFSVVLPTWVDPLNMAGYLEDTEAQTFGVLRLLRPQTSMKR